MSRPPELEIYAPPTVTCPSPIFERSKYRYTVDVVMSVGVLCYVAGILTTTALTIMVASLLP